MSSFFLLDTKRQRTDRLVTRFPPSLCLIGPVRWHTDMSSAVISVPQSFAMLTSFSVSCSFVSFSSSTIPDTLIVSRLEYCSWRSSSYLSRRDWRCTVAPTSSVAVVTACFTILSTTAPIAALIAFVWYKSCDHLTGDLGSQVTTVWHCHGRGGLGSWVARTRQVHWLAVLMTLWLLAYFLFCWLWGNITLPEGPSVGSWHCSINVAFIPSLLDAGGWGWPPRFHTVVTCAQKAMCAALVFFPHFRRYTQRLRTCRSSLSLSQ